MLTEELRQALTALLSENELVEDAQPFLLDQRKRYEGRADAVVQPASVAGVQALMRFVRSIKSR